MKRILAVVIALTAPPALATDWSERVDDPYDDYPRIILRDGKPELIRRPKADGVHRPEGIGPIPRRRDDNVDGVRERKKDRSDRRK